MASDHWKLLTEIGDASLPSVGGEVRIIDKIECDYNVALTLDVEYRY